MKEELRAVAVFGTLPIVIYLDIDDIGHMRFCVITGRDGRLEVAHLARLALARVHEALDEGRQSKGTGVHDAVLLENGKQLRGTRDRFVSLGHNSIEGLSRCGLSLLKLVRLCRDIPEHCEDGALDGLADGLEGDLDTVSEREGDVGRSDAHAPGVREPLSNAAQYLACDDTRVAARAHERAMGDCLRDVTHGGALGKRLYLLDHRTQGKGHVGARISIGNGKDVEFVDLVCLVSNNLGRHGEAATNDVGNHSLENLGSSLVGG